MSENSWLTINTRYISNIGYLRCDNGVVDNQIKKGLLLNLPVEKLKIGDWQSYKQESGCLMHFLHHLAVWWPGAQYC